MVERIEFQILCSKEWIWKFYFFSHKLNVSHHGRLLLPSHWPRQLQSHHRRHRPSESVIAIVASAIDKTILHLDPNSFYGSHFASLSFHDLTSPHSLPSAASSDSDDIIVVDLVHQPLCTDAKTTTYDEFAFLSENSTSIWEVQGQCYARTRRSICWWNRARRNIWSSKELTRALSMKWMRVWRMCWILEERFLETRSFHWRRRTSWWSSSSWFNSTTMISKHRILKIKKFKLNYLKFSEFISSKHTLKVNWKFKFWINLSKCKRSVMRVLWCVTRNLPSR